MTVPKQHASFKAQATLAALRQLLVMGHQNQRGALLFVEAEEQVDYARTGGAIQISGRLVGQQQMGPGGKGAGDGHALLFAAGKLARIMGEPLRQTDPLHHGDRLFAGMGGPGQLQRQHRVFQCGKRRQQLERLEYEAHQASAQCGPAVLVQGEQIDAIEQNLAAAGLIQAGQQAEQG